MARLSEKVEAVGMLGPTEGSGRYSHERGCHEVRSVYENGRFYGYKVQRQLHKQCLTYHRVVTDAEFLPANCASECIRPIVSVIPPEL